MRQMSCDESVVFLHVATMLFSDNVAYITSAFSPHWPQLSWPPALHYVHYTPRVRGLSLWPDTLCPLTPPGNWPYCHYQGCGTSSHAPCRGSLISHTLPTPHTDSKCIERSHIMHLSTSQMDSQLTAEWPLVASEDTLMAWPCFMCWASYIMSTGRLLGGGGCPGEWGGLSTAWPIHDLCCAGMGHEVSLIVLTMIDTQHDDGGYHEWQHVSYTHERHTDVHKLHRCFYHIEVVKAFPCMYFSFCRATFYRVWEKTTGFLLCPGDRERENYFWIFVVKMSKCWSLGTLQWPCIWNVHVG